MLCPNSVADGQNILTNHLLELDSISFSHHRLPLILFQEIKYWQHMQITLDTVSLHLKPFHFKSFCFKIVDLKKCAQVCGVFLLPHVYVNV